MNKNNSYKYKIFLTPSFYRCSKWYIEQLAIEYEGILFKEFSLNNGENMCFGFKTHNNLFKFRDSLYSLKRDLNLENPID